MDVKKSAVNDTCFTSLSPASTRLRMSSYSLWRMSLMHFLGSKKVMKPHPLHNSHGTHVPCHKLSNSLSYISFARLLPRGSLGDSFRKNASIMVCCWLLPLSPIDRTSGCQVSKCCLRLVVLLLTLLSHNLQCTAVSSTLYPLISNSNWSHTALVAPLGFWSQSSFRPSWPITNLLP